MTNVTPRFVPVLPWVSAFPELNVRTYVRVGGKPGVFFFSLDAGNPVAVGAARTLLNLPYFTADMTVAGGRRRDTIAAGARAAAPRNSIATVPRPRRSPAAACPARSNTS